MLNGGCYCQKTRYTIEAGDYRCVNCHCSICRKTSAAPFVTWIVVPKTSVNISGAPLTTLRSSSSGTRQFCSACGTPLIFTEIDRPEEMDITLCSLDNPEVFSPGNAIHEDTKLAWLRRTE